MMTRQPRRSADHGSSTNLCRDPGRDDREEMLLVGNPVSGGETRAATTATTPSGSRESFADKRRRTSAARRPHPGHRCASPARCGIPWPAVLRASRSWPGRSCPGRWRGRHVPPPGSRHACFRRCAPGTALPTTLRWPRIGGLPQGRWAQFRRDRPRWHRRRPRRRAQRSVQLGADPLRGGLETQHPDQDRLPAADHREPGHELAAQMHGPSRCSRPRAPCGSIHYLIGPRAPGSRLPAPGSRLPAPGSRLPAPGSRLPAPGSRLPAPGSRLPAPGSRLPAPGSRLPAPGSRLPDQYRGTPDAHLLRQWIPDIAEHDVFVCGPASWTGTVVASGTSAGVPATHIHTETFAW
ncbi:hypothetical protein ATK36_1139 [Amycolatopsis sulphurea]|uniref:Uncharacterized protein n=1 Tax=Amycolatopsis sulphurea TaxID=76022 RepID=A0A2A9G1E2_9PSEU|nr:hypothetical protein ATK36_1139 [Amycolatopsis sulphurea]